MDGGAVVAVCERPEKRLFGRSAAADPPRGGRDGLDQGVGVALAHEDAGGFGSDGGPFLGVAGTGTGTGVVYIYVYIFVGGGTGVVVLLLSVPVSVAPGLGGGGSGHCGWGVCLGEVRDWALISAGLISL